jgi:hypothetical protein
VVLTLDHRLHGFDFTGCQASGNDPRTAGLVIEFAPGLGTTPTVVARRREARDPQRRPQRQNLSCTFDRSQQDSLGIAIWNSLVIELNFRYAKHGDQQANHRTE